jgi:hypothetical protein
LRSGFTTSCLLRFSPEMMFGCGAIRHARLLT